MKSSQQDNEATKDKVTAPFNSYAEEDVSSNGGRFFQLSMMSCQTLPKTLFHEAITRG